MVPALGPLIGRDLLIALATEQDHLVAGLTTSSPQSITHVHRDHPARGSAGVDKDFGAGVEQSAGIASA